jgi:hypothetical protein
MPVLLIELFSSLQLCFGRLERFIARDLEMIEKSYWIRVHFRIVV